MQGLEIDGGMPWSSCLKNSTGINLSNSKVRFLGRAMELGVSEDMLGRVFDGMGSTTMAARRFCPRKEWTSTDSR
jgi:V/A-type H+-transporting ATPase subunit B